MAIAGNVVRTVRRILDQNDAPLGGLTMPADITATLFRDTGVDISVASETVAMAPVIGSTGDYYVTFTPLSSGLYTLILREINANTGLRQTRDQFQVYASGTLFQPTFANAFCALTDIERWTQTAITSTTDPSDSEAAGFAEARASILQSLLGRLNYPLTPMTVQSGSRLQDILREANAIGAALDYTIAQQFRQSPSRSDRVDYLMGMWQQYYGQGPVQGTPGAKPAGPGFIEMEIRGNLASLATSNTLSGDTTPRDNSDQPQDIGFLITMGDFY